MSFELQTIPAGHGSLGRLNSPCSSTKRRWGFTDSRPQTHLLWLPKNLQIHFLSWVIQHPILWRYACWRPKSFQTGGADKDVERMGVQWGGQWVRISITRVGRTWQSEGELCVSGSKDNNSALMVEGNPEFVGTQRKPIRVKTSEKSMLKNSYTFLEIVAGWVVPKEEVDIQN